MFAVVHADTNRQFYGEVTEPAVFTERENAEAVAGFFSGVYGPLTVQEV